MPAAALLATLLVGGAGERVEVVGYLPAYRLKAATAATVRGVDRAVYFGPTPAADGTLPAIPEEDLAALRRLQRETGVRLSVCVGGWDTSAAFNAACATAASRAALLSPLCRLSGGRPFDGVVFDWEHPATDLEKARYAALLRDAAALGRVGVAAAPWKDVGPEVVAAADRVHLMSYDHAFPHATPEKTRADLDAAWVAAVPPEKLLLGLPFYGRRENWSPVTAADVFRGEPALAGDRSAGGVALNNAATLRGKVRLARSRGLAGVMIWELGQDAADGRLLRAIVDEAGAVP